MTCCLLLALQKSVKCSAVRSLALVLAKDVRRAHSHSRRHSTDDTQVWGGRGRFTCLVLTDFAQAAGVHRQSGLLKDAPLHQRT
eukprot:COSAG02_NODE_3242_length_7111_cov_2.874786_1_plen_84_part_00